MKKVFSVFHVSLLVGKSGIQATTSISLGQVMLQIPSNGLMIVIFARETQLKMYHIMGYCKLWRFPLGE